MEKLPLVVEKKQTFHCGCEGNVRHRIVLLACVFGRRRTNNVITVSESSSKFLDVLSEQCRMKLSEGYMMGGKNRDCFL